MEGTCAKVPEGRAEKARRAFMRLGIIDSSRRTEHSRGYVYFPILASAAKNIKLPHGASVVHTAAKPSARKESFAAELRNILTVKERALLERGYELLGSIAIVGSKLPAAKERAVAQALMRSNSSIETVLAKAGPVSGEYRVRKVRYVAGKRNYVATYRENNCVFRFDVRKVYFSGNLSFERGLIATRVRDGESVMVMFAGVGPFAIEIAKARPRTRVVAIELNRYGYESMLDNIKLNKTPNVKAVLGDVREVYKKYRNSADRVIMPLPMSSLDFLDEAYAVAKRGAVIDIYGFGTNGKAFEEVWGKIRAHAAGKGYSAKMLSKRVVRPYSATEVEVGIEYRITKPRKG